MHHSKEYKSRYLLLSFIIGRINKVIMPEISVRGLEMPESPIRKLAPLAVAAKKRGIKVYHLNIGQPDLPTPQCGLDALKKIDRKLLEYSPSQGYLSYREKLCDFYEKFNINVTPDDIIITAGGSDSTRLLIDKFLKLLNLRQCKSFFYRGCNRLYLCTC